MSCHLFGKELLTRLFTSNFIVREDMLFIFPFDVGDKLWGVIWSAPGVSLLIQFV